MVEESQLSMSELQRFFAAKNIEDCNPTFCSPWAKISTIWDFNAKTLSCDVRGLMMSLFVDPL